MQCTAKVKDSGLKAHSGVLAGDMRTYIQNEKSPVINDVRGS